NTPSSRKRLGVLFLVVQKNAEGKRRPFHYLIRCLLSADRQPHKKEHAARALFIDGMRGMAKGPN
ncbi:hypothetical protein, partial [Comamonas terrigena]|uniref:hypothetical protein n=1 Tax=Comamonas terrigena TaxID=32013 RepID=UPI00244AD7A2